MAMDQKTRSAKSAAKRKELGEEELRHRVRAGDKQMLAELMAWTEDTEQASVIAGCLRYVHSLGRDGAREALRSRHKIEVTENVAAELYAIGQRQASRLDAEEA
ncbi:hypothetical protein RGV33_11915 [Pseudomonas sp. Bout1]|uniref:hypothetical protein n=1 Tax=Pseudomonas sp. Bout1 TaxID=3048600 RepID=UPI002AB423E2|nr:hypothetical protein [Pseudomonas sp. Bout1]MDY7532372.1 hypothetical protein [Pseudomonas sp. Bout1]MEB0184055.1 hypothetical protein [Pseudomonas sp. Bout1]